MGFVLGSNNLENDFTHISVTDICEFLACKRYPNFSYCICPNSVVTYHQKPPRSQNGVFVYLKKGGSMSHYQIKNTDTGETTEVDIASVLRPATILPIPYVSQIGLGADQHNNDCGAASGTMLLRGYNLAPNMTPDQFYNETGNAGDTYLGVGHIQKVLENHGLKTEWLIGLSISSLFDFLNNQKPVMLLFKYGTLVDANLTEKKGFRGPHFALAVGIDSQYIYINDPYYTGKGGEAKAYPLNVFQQAWDAVGENNDNPRRGGLVPRIVLGNIKEKMVEPVLFRVRVTHPQWLNIRNGPGMNFADIGDLLPGTIVDAYEEKNSWARIGTGRWICMGPGLSERI
jgi:hypothetical protein